MNIALWIIQALLALLFLASGARKLTQPQVALVKATPPLGDFPLPFVRFIGAAELLGGIGLILPAATRIAPVLTPAAAAGIALLMVCATVVQAARGEYAKIGLTCGLLLLAVVVMYGRLVLVPIDGASPDDHSWVLLRPAAAGDETARPRPWCPAWAGAQGGKRAAGSSRSGNRKEVVDRRTVNDLRE